VKWRESNPTNDGFGGKQFGIRVRVWNWGKWEGWECAGFLNPSLTYQSTYLNLDSLHHHFCYSVMNWNTQLYVTKPPFQ